MGDFRLQPAALRPLLIWADVIRQHVACGVIPFAFPLCLPRAAEDAHLFGRPYRVVASFYPQQYRLGKLIPLRRLWRFAVRCSRGGSGAAHRDVPA